MIELQQVSKIYKKKTAAVNAVDGVDLQIKDGEIVGLIGVSGSGKTTILNLIGGLDAPTSGSILVNGAELTKLKGKDLTSYRRDEVGFVFQFFHLIPSLTVLENVMLPLVPLRMGAGEKRSKSMKLIEEVGLSGRASHLPGELSGGEQQRVAIARALVNDPKIILADEPTSDLDTDTGNQIVELLCRFNEQGKTIIFASHNEKLAEAANHLIRISDGKVVEEKRKN